MRPGDSIGRARKTCGWGARLGQGGQVSIEEFAASVPRQDVEAGVDDEGRVRVEVGQQQFVLPGQFGAVPGGGVAGRHLAREAEEVVPLRGVQTESACQAAEHLTRDTDLARLLQPGVPGDAHVGDGRHLLEPKARSTPVADGRKPHVLGPVPLSPAADELGELVALFVGGHLISFSSTPPPTVIGGHR